MDQHEASPASALTCRGSPSKRDKTFGHADLANPVLGGAWRPSTASVPPHRGQLDFSLSYFMRELSEAMNPDELFDELVAFAEDVGCPWVAYASLTHDNMVTVATREYPAILLNYPLEWQKRYCERAYYRIDPILWWGRRQVVAFRWAEVYRHPDTNKDNKRVFDDAAVFGLREGISIPLHGPNGRLAIVSFVETQKNGTEDCNIAHLQAAAYQFHAAFSKMFINSRSIVLPDLSRREQECLLWAAEGKSSWDTGMILGISENTVNFHIKNAMRKFGTGSRTVAIVKALKLGLLP